MELYKEELTKSEEFRTIIESIMIMPDTTRHRFYESPEGKNIIKGLQLEAENDKTYTGAGHQMTKNELDELIDRLFQCSVEQRHAIIQMLPGPVISVLMNALKEPKPYPMINERAQIKKSVEDEVEKGIGAVSPSTGVATGTGGRRGPVKGTPGYESWHAHLIATRAAKRKTNENNYGGTIKKRDYKHFIRQVKPGGEIADTPSDGKSY